MKIAIVHDWLTTYAGAERVLQQILAMYPQADLFCVCDFLPEADRHILDGRSPTTTFIQKLPLARTRYRSYLPLMPLAVEQLDVTAYDMVISSSHAVAKGVLTGPDQVHVSYVHTPIRYAWDLQHQYLRESGLDRGLKGIVAKYFLHRIRLWDLRTANGVDRFVANSSFIARRIWKAYRRRATVIFPPVDVDAFTVVSNMDEYYLTASRLVPYKRIDLIVKAFAAMPDKRLKVIGDGPEMPKLQRIAQSHPNIELMGYRTSTELADCMGRARAFVFAAEEDFGIIPVEAQACGTPVIAFGRGGALETVNDLNDPAPTGVFFPEQSADAIRTAVEAFEQEGGAITASACRANAERFSAARFREQFGEFIEGAWAARGDPAVQCDD